MSCTRLFCARSTLLLENLALRQQLAVLKRRQPRARLGLADKLFWVVVRRLWSGWKSALIVVKPETVIHWHRTAFQIYWRWISHFKGRTGRKQISKDMRDLIFRMVAENRTWGAPAFTASFSCWALLCLSKRFLAGCAVHREIQNQPGAGSPSFEITVRLRSRRVDLINHTDLAAIKPCWRSAQFPGKSRLPSAIKPDFLICRNTQVGESLRFLPWM